MGWQREATGLWDMLHWTSYIIPMGYGKSVTLFISCRLKDINEFFTRSKAEYLALIFEREDSYLGREVSCPRLPDSQKRPWGESPVQTNAGNWSLYIY